MPQTPAQCTTPPTEPVSPTGEYPKPSFACRPVFSPEFRREVDRFPVRAKYTGRGTVDPSFVFAKPPKPHQLKHHKPKPLYISVESRLLPPLPPMEVANKARLLTKAEAPIA